MMISSSPLVTLIATAVVANARVPSYKHLRICHHTLTSFNFFFQFCFLFSSSLLNITRNRYFWLQPCKMHVVEALKMRCCYRWPELGVPVDPSVRLEKCSQWVSHVKSISVWNFEKVAGTLPQSQPNCDMSLGEKIWSSKWRRVIFLGFLLLIYTLVGAAVFVALESTDEETRKRDLQIELKRFANETGISAGLLRNFTERYRRLAEHGAASSVNNWEFGASFFFALTVVTTIGKKEKKWRERLIKLKKEEKFDKKI